MRLFTTTPTTPTTPTATTALVTLAVCAAACGGVTANDNGNGEPDASVADGQSADASPDSGDGCVAFEAPVAALSIHDQFCGDALGLNPAMDPTVMTLECPSTSPTTGPYGAVLLPASMAQGDGCPATAPIMQIITATGTGALVDSSTGRTATIAAGDSLRVRVACPAGVTCSASFQITGSIGQQVTQIFPAAGGTFEPVTGTDVIDVDAAIPAALVGSNRVLSVIVQTRDVDTAANLLFENPHIVSL